MRRVYRLPERLRAELAEPLGRVFTAGEVQGEDFMEIVRRAAMVVTVGDRVTETLDRVGRTPDVQVVDGVERRGRRGLPEVRYARLVKVKNPAGTLTLGAVGGMSRAFEGKKPVRVLVDGEEDLVAVLAIAMAPASAVVFYGQPKVGVVTVKVDGRSRSRSRAILAKMGMRGIRGPSS